ncbi:MAG: hypothetical protein QOG50_719 [Actinomycetota bacterium]|nr:hypothetical protein [Actinomycetota bacterium]
MPSDGLAMDRRPVTALAWLLSGATGVAIVVLAARQIITQGEHQFFASGDPRFFFLTTRELFGTGHGFLALGAAADIPYRYGRMGLPLLGWLLAFGRPGLVGWTLIGVNLAALTAIPGLAALLLAEHRGAPVGAAFILVLPPYVLLYGSVVSDPLLIALLLLAYLLDARDHRRSALVVVAYAILVKEVAVLALLPLVWRAVRERDRRMTLAVASTLVPYAAWCVWLRWRVGTLPFFAPTESRKGAMGLPFAGFRHVLLQRPADSAVILVMTTAVIVLGAAGAWAARGNQIGGLAAIYTLMTVCLGPRGLRFIGEVPRVLLLPEVFGLLALIIGLRNVLPQPAALEDPVDHGLFVGMQDL